MTTTTRVCQDGSCGRPLVAQRSDARYCNDTCRQRGQRGRRGHREARTRDIIRDRLPGARSARIAPVVTDNPHILQGSKRPSRPLDPRIVLDDKWPGMYRIRLREGSLSDMVNLTRARAAVG
jgi:hypothetical protein